MPGQPNHVPTFGVSNIYVDVKNKCGKDGKLIRATQELQPSSKEGEVKRKISFLNLLEQDDGYVVEKVLLHDIIPVQELENMKSKGRSDRVDVKTLCPPVQRFGEIPVLGEYKLISSTEKFDVCLALDFESLSVSDICQIRGEDIQPQDDVQYDIDETTNDAEMFGFLGEAKEHIHSYREGDDIVDCLHISNTLSDHILNYAAYNGFLYFSTEDLLDKSICTSEAYASAKYKFRHDGGRYLKVVRRILDSGASHSMSGDKRRTKFIEKIDMSIRGFDGNTAPAESYGLNEDGFREIYVPSIPEDIVLLCLYDYASHGCVYLTQEGGRVIELTPQQRVALEELLDTYPTAHTLHVEHGVYVMDDKHDEVQARHAAIELESAFWSGVAMRAGIYFNGRVNFNSVSDRILGLLMSGLSFGAIRHAVLNQSIGGVHPSITKQALARFERDHGRSPDIVQKALVHQQANQKAFGRVKKPLTFVGERVEMDAFTWDANDRAPIGSKRNQTNLEREQELLLEKDDTNAYVERKRVYKLPEMGGADHCEIWIDCFSGKVFGKLRKPQSKAIDSVKELISTFGSLGVKIKTLAADSGYISDSQYRVFTSKVVELLRESSILVERSEPYNHSLGTAHVENMVGLVKKLMKQAYRYVEENENTKKLKFKEIDILMLWGEIFHWAVSVINFYPCPRVEDKSRHEVFTGEQPNIQHFRLLPIFSTVLVWQRVPQRDAEKMKEKQKTGNIKPGDYYDQPTYVYGLYVGFEESVPGNIRVAIPTDKGVKVIGTSKYGGVSEGGGVDISEAYQRAADKMIAEVDHGINEGATNQLETLIEADESNVIDEMDLREERAKDVVMRNKKVYHDRTEYNPIKFPSRSERARRRNGRANYSKFMTANHADITVQLNEIEFDQKKFSADILAAIRRQDVLADKEEELKLLNMLKANVELNGKPFVWTSSGDYILEKKRDLTEAMMIQGEQLGNSFFADWSTVLEKATNYFANFAIGSFVKLVSQETPKDFQYNPSEEIIAEGFRAVTVGVPRNFLEALKSPEWGDAARKEFNDLMQKAMVKVPAEIAIQAIAQGSDCLTLFPVYEEKTRDGVIVRKVRLVADGRRHETAGPTYASTPSKDEFFMFLDMIARNDWDWCHVDEDRAFLNADRQDEIPLFARMKGSKDWFQIIRALYGLKTSTRDHAASAAVRLEKMGFKRKGMCMNIFSKHFVNADGSTRVVHVYQYVDDYFFAGNLKSDVEEAVLLFKSKIPSSEPFWNPDKGLGMEFKRDRVRKIIEIRMTKTIQRMAEEFVKATKGLNVDVPIPKSKFIADRGEFDDLVLQEVKDAEKANLEGCSLYLKMVGAILWVSGFRWDILLSIIYLTWFSNEPRLHHIKLAERVIRYLEQTVDLPLVLGGTDKPQLCTSCDASLGTGPKSRSIIAIGTRLSEKSGFVSTKVKATDYMALSSFEGEINGYFEGFKMSAREMNIAAELEYQIDPIRVITGDNEKAIQFIKGEAEGKGIRHAMRRFSYMREEYQKGNINFNWQPGDGLVVDGMTKPLDVEGFLKFRFDALGHGLLG